jgi:hypothetical protein
MEVVAAGLTVLLKDIRHRFLEERERLSLGQRIQRIGNDGLLEPRLVPQTRAIRPGEARKVKLVCETALAPARMEMNSISNFCTGVYFRIFW